MYALCKFALFIVQTMGLPTAFGKALAREAQTCSTTYDALAKNELKDCKHVSLWIDFSATVKAVCGSSKGSNEKNTEQLIRDACFDCILGLPKCFKQVTLVRDSGVPRNKRSTVKARKEEGYEGDKKMGDFKDDLNPKLFASTPRLVSEMIKRMTESGDKDGFASKDGTHTTIIDVKDFRFISSEETKFLWKALPNTPKRQMEADLRIPELLLTDEAADAHVVDGNDTDYALILLSRIQDFPSYFQDRKVYLLRRIPGHTCCWEMVALFRTWVGKYGNLWSLFVPALMCKCDPEPFNKKVLFKNIGDETVIERAQDLFKNERYVECFQDPEGFCSVLRKLYIDCCRNPATPSNKKRRREESEEEEKEGKRTKRRVVYTKTEEKIIEGSFVGNLVDEKNSSAEDKWKAACAEQYPFAMQVIKYWRGQEVDESVWDKKKPAPAPLVDVA
jgi:hypothetical protein